MSFAVVAACASDKPGRTTLADGSYQLACRKPLADCLAALTDVCRAHGYDVIRGKETITRNGVEPVDSEIVASEAIVRCRSAPTVFGSEAHQTAHVAPHPSAAPAGAARCFPGTTQSCLGPGACKGAQTCSANGATFGPCDCGAQAASLAGPSDADAGPPPTWAVPPGDGGAP
jgi:hypothetical protein